MQPDKSALVPGPEPTEPWRSFLRALDQLLKGRVDLRCLGGFVVSQHYGIGRETADIDFLAVSAEFPEDDVQRLAGLGSALHARYRLYVQYVGIVTPPAGHAERLARMFPAAPWQRLGLYALDSTDLALSKLERNAERDREDFLNLTRAGLVDLEVFRRRYFEEVRPYLLDRLTWHDKTLELWLAMAQELRSTRR